MLGSYSCICRFGYQIMFDEQNCNSGLSCNFGELCCENCLEINCEDVNECEDSEFCDQMCYNIDGSYYCLCYEGYQFVVDGRFCEDVDEC